MNSIYQKTKRMDFLCFLLIIFILTSCEKDNVPPYQTNDVYVMESKERLDPLTTDLSVNDALIVANLSKNKFTRSNTAGSVRNVETIFDDNHKPVIYAVNFEDGYMLISATRKYYPILAIVDHGSYKCDLNNGAFNLIVKDMIESIKAARDGNIKESYTNLWSKYVENEKFHSIERKTRSVDDDYWLAFENWYASVNVNENVKIRKLKNCSDVLPENVYQSFTSEAANLDLWEGTTYNWENTAYVVEETIERSNTTGPLLSTKWSQTGTFNTTDYQYLGCVTVAVGQLMRYYEQPSSISWKDMPDTYGNPTLTNFLAKLRSELKVSDSGSSNIDNAERVLKSYGYSVDKIKHDATRIYSSLKQNKPVYARGEDEIGGKGHAWVIDGLYHSETIIRYTLYHLSDLAYPQFKYEEVDGGTFEQYSALTTYHMNWGWKGQNNGWFIDQRPWIMENGTYTYKFSKDRKELIFK